MKKILLLGSGELGKEFVISAKRLGCYVIACDSYAGSGPRDEEINYFLPAARARALARMSAESRLTAGAATCGATTGGGMSAASENMSATPASSSAESSAAGGSHGAGGSALTGAREAAGFTAGTAWRVTVFW
jgi:hypothetical protein